MMVDDAHASGVLGRNGRGTIDHFELHGRVDVQVGTLSKAIGALGGYVCGTRDLIEFLYHRGAAVPVLDLASAVGRGHLHRRLRRAGAGARAHRKALGEHALLEEGTRRARLQHRRRQHAGQRDADHAHHRRRRPLTMDFSRELFKEGVMGTGIAFPTVPEGKARIRTIMTATHTREELDQALDTLKRVGKRMGILG